MAVGIGASGFVGIAFEATANTYEAPTKFFPVTEETLKFIQETVWRRPVRGHADVHGGVAGNVRIEGNLGFECQESVLPYFLYAGRWTIVKTGTTPNFTYTATPAHSATAASGRTLSITVVRNGIVFGYVGCVATDYSFTVDNGLLMATVSIIGSDEEVESLPVPTFDDSVPFGAGTYTVSIPTGSPVEDTDEFTLNIGNSGEAQYRLRNSRGAKFIKYGERSVELNFARDFESRTDYDAFKALTAQSITLLASKGANNQVSFLVPSAVKNDYEITGIGEQGELIRAGVSYMGTYDATDGSVKIICKTQEDIT